METRKMGQEKFERFPGKTLGKLQMFFLNFQLHQKSQAKTEFLTEKIFVKLQVHHECYQGKFLSCSQIGSRKDQKRLRWFGVVAF